MRTQKKVAAAGFTARNARHGSGGDRSDIAYVKEDSVVVQMDIKKKKRKKCKSL